MSQINQIQEELRQIEGGRFQTLANQYLYRRYSLNNIIELGSQCGTDKTTTGVPDMYSVGENGHYLFAAYTTSKSDIRNKLLNDAKDCLDRSKTGINPQLIDRIILYHTYFRLSPLVLEEVRAIDPRIEIIGPETIASDLDGKYPALAHTVLGVPLGKGSFIAPRPLHRAKPERPFLNRPVEAPHAQGFRVFSHRRIDRAKQGSGDSGAVWIGENQDRPRRMPLIQQTASLGSSYLGL